MGINQLNNTGIELIYGISGGVTTGDLVSNSETGYITKSSEGLGVALENNTTAGAVAVKAIASIESNTNYDGGSGLFPVRRMCELGNNNIALVYSGEGAATTGVRCRIRSVLGADIASRVSVTEDSVDSFRCIKLSTAKFVVAWANTGAVLKFMILNNDGTTSVAATTVATLGVTASSSPWNLAVTASGDIVFSYDKVTSRDAVFSRYNSSGVLQGSETTVEAGATPLEMKVLACSGGHFVIAYLRTAATAAYKFARYNASGVIQGSLVTVLNSSGPLSYGDYSNGLIELTGGNIVLVAAGAADSYPNLHVYNSSNTLVKTIDLGTGITAVENPQLIPITSGGFAVIYRNASTQSRLATFDSLGGGLLAPTLIGTAGVGAGGGAYGSGITAFSLGTAGFAVLRVGYSSSPLYDVRLFVVSTLGVAVGSEIVLRASGADAIENTSAILHSSGVLCFAFSDVVSPYLADGYYNMLRRSIIGVAAETVSLGSTVMVSTDGTFTINQAFSVGGLFDNTATTVPGSKGTVIGNSVILRGTK